MNRRAAAWCLILAIGLAGGRSAAGEPCAAEDALRATFRIKGAASGTGFIVAVDQRTVLVTAAHALENLKSDNCTLVLRAPGKDGTFVRKETIVPIRQNGKPLWVRHAEMDVAAIFVSLPAGVDVKPLEYRQLADESWAAEGRIRVGTPVSIACFPSQLEANPAGWPVLRTGAIASHPLTPLRAAKTILVDYSQFGGDSGAPVLLCDGPRPIVVGLVSAMHRQTSKFSMPFEERTVHTPLGLAIVVQSPFLRETVGMLLKK